MLKECIGMYRVYLVPGYTDLRKGIDGLATILKLQHGMDPFNQALYLFCGRGTKKLRGLIWEEDGFVLLNKRLESGTYQWPRTGDEVLELTDQQIRWLLEGLKIRQHKAIQSVKSVPLY